MHQRAFLLAILLLPTGVLCQSVTTTEQELPTALRGLPFCAFLYYEDEAATRFSMKILMDQDDISEDNLRILFQMVSQRYRDVLRLEAHVNTNRDAMISMGSVAQREFINPSGRSKKGDEDSEAKGLSGAFYLRSEKVELFRYNPIYPRQGLKTVIIRGSE